MHSRFLLLCLTALVFVAGCEEERTRPPSTTLSVINAAPGFTSLQLRRGPSDRASLGEVQFPGVFGATFDSGPYNFAVDTIDNLTGITLELATFSEELGPDQRHVFVLAELNRSVVPVRMARDPIDPDSAGWDLTVVNAAEGATSVDFFLTAPGTDLSTVSPLGTVNFSGTLLTEALSPGEYVITLTEAGNSANVLFTSTTTQFNAGVWTQIVVVPDVKGYDGVLSLIVRSSSSFNLTDVNAPTRVRLFNGAADMLARDFYVGGDFTTPLAGAVEFAVSTDFLAVPDGTNQISVTPAGNVSVVETELTQALTSGTIYEAAVAGPAGALEIVAGADNRRRNNINARIMLINTASYYETLNAYIVKPGTDVTGRLPNWTLTTLAVTARAEFPADDFELTVTDTVTNNIVLGPLALTLEDRGLYTVAIVDSGDGTTLSAVLLDDLQ